MLGYLVHARAVLELVLPDVREPVRYAHALWRLGLDTPDALRGTKDLETYLVAETGMRREHARRFAEEFGGRAASSIQAPTEEGGETSLQRLMQSILAKMPPEERVGGRFDGHVHTLSMADADAAVFGLHEYMCISDAQIAALLAGKDHGTRAMEAEFARSGTPDDLECFRYVRYGRTGDSARQWPNGVMDADRPSGLKLSDFVDTETATRARLHVGHVLALRLYTTACYKSLNGPMRGTGVDGQPHRLGRFRPYPFPVTMHLLKDAVCRLRSVDRRRGQRVVLWRGMRNMHVDVDAFLRDGGAEMAPMSTTSDLQVAVRYSASSSSVLLKLDTETFMDRGADLAFVSAFPRESEFLFPPLTHLQPTRTQRVALGHETYTVVEVRPRFPS